MPKSFYVALGPAIISDSSRRSREDLPGLLDARQAAAYLNIGRNRVYALADSGELPVIRIGKTLRFSQAALDQWITTTSGIDAWIAERSSRAS